MDKSLDDIISSKPKTRRGAARRSSARAQVLGTTAVTPAQRARVANAPPTTRAKAAVPPAATKIIVSNLPVDVNESQIKELFTTTVGPLRDVTLHYDAAGRSKGVASVQFSAKGDGEVAYQQYNNRLIDGKRPMKIEIVVDPRPVSLASRVAPAPAAAQPARNGTAARGGRPRRGRGGVRKAERTPKTAADLDAEMEDYTASNAPAAAT